MTQGLTGNLSTNGQINVTGNRSVGVNLASNITGNVTNAGSVSVRGEDAVAYAIAGDITGGFNSSGALRSTGFRDVSQFGSAPAVLIDGGGAVIDIGIVAAITNPNGGGETGQYGFINQGSVSAAGVYGDFDATAISVANVTFAGGISNEGSLGATTFRAANATSLTDGAGVARVLVLGDQAIADEINNSGVMIATANEAADEIYFDRENIIAPRSLTAITLDIGAGASVTDLVNTGAITAALVGRDGTAIAVRDASGTVRTLSNTGAILAAGSNSDSLDAEETNFNLIAIDFSAATQAVEITQSQDDVRTATPFIFGDVLTAHLFSVPRLMAKQEKPLPWSRRGILPLKKAQRLIRFWTLLLAQIHFPTLWRAQEI